MAALLSLSTTMFRFIPFGTLLLILLPLQVLARDYRVEAIIFSNVMEAESATESWDDKAPRNIRAQNRLDTLFLDAREAEELRQEAARESIRTGTDNAEEDAPVITIVTDALDGLDDMRETLEQNPRYELLQTLSWEQSEADYLHSPLIPVLTPHMKGVIRVYAPNLLFTELTLVYVPDDILEESLETEEGEVAATIIREPVTYTVGEPYDPYSVVETEPARFYLEEQRKLKLNEIHYFDHPRYGVILSVIPLEENEETETDTPS